MNSAKRNLWVKSEHYTDAEYPRGTLLRSGYFPKSNLIVKILENYFAYFVVYDLNGDRRKRRDVFKADVHRGDYVKLTQHP